MILKEWTLSVEKADGSGDIKWLPLVATDAEAWLCWKCVERSYENDESFDIYLNDEGEYIKRGADD